MGHGRSSRLNLPRVYRIRLPSKLDVVWGVGVVRLVSLGTPTRRQVDCTRRPRFLFPEKAPPLGNFLHPGLVLHQPPAHAGPQLLQCLLPPLFHGSMWLTRASCKVLHMAAVNHVSLSPSLWVTIAAHVRNFW